MLISPRAVIYPNVEVGENVIIEDFCIIGSPLEQDPNAKTVIGDGARIRSHTVIYAGNIIGSNFSTGNKANIREYNRIGNNVSIGTLSVIEYKCDIGNGVRVHSHSFIPEYSILRDNCWIGPNVVLTNAKYPQSRGAKDRLKGPTIGYNAIISANVTILPGINIADYCLIAAGSLVAHDTKKNGVYMGCPAKFIKFIREINEYGNHPTF